MKKLLIPIFILLSALALNAQEASLIERVEITPNPVGRGDIFNLVVVVDHPVSREVDFPLKGLPEELILWKGPYVRTFIDTAKGKETIRKTRITVTFKAQNSGRQVLPAQPVIVAGRVEMTEPQLLRVGLYKNRQLYIPLEVEWQPAFDDIYAGEAVPLLLTVKNQEVVSLFDKTRVEVPRDGFFERAEALGGITAEVYGDIVLYDIPAAAYLYTSPVAGEVRIPAAGVDYDGITGWADELYLRIKPVPEEVSSTGAIGNFNFTSSVSRDSVEAGAEVVLTCTVAGTGNLNYLNLADPEVEGLILAAREEGSDLRQSLLGFAGKKEYRWIFTAEKAGQGVLRVPDFVYLEKDTDLVRTVPGSRFRVQISSPSQPQQDGEEEEVFPFKKITDPSLQGKNWNNHYLNLLSYIWLLPGLIFFIIVIIMKQRRLQIALLITVVIMVAAVSMVKTFGGNRSDSLDNNHFHAEYYNKAIDLYKDGYIGRSLHNLRTAIYLDPVNKHYRGVLHWIEDRHGFVSSISPSVNMHPDIFYYTLIAAVNLFFLALLFRVTKPGGAASVSFALTVLMIIISLSLTAFTVHRRSALTGVTAGEEIFLRKIPRDSAGLWLQLKDGTAVKILDETGEYRLIETGLGVSGWVNSEALLLDRAAENGDG